jgi:GNAT superfamily N-acetyltransferase
MMTGDTDTDSDLEFRPATHDDYDRVAAFTQDTWDDASDYIPDVYHDWIEGEGKRTLVADAGEDIAGIAQCVLLSEHEAWGQGIRVNPDFRGQGVASAITHHLFDWAREQGATVMRNMVFSWNEAGLGQSRATGYEPATEFRWLHPDPDPTATEAVDSGLTVVDEPAVAWTAWLDSDARDHLRGLGLSLDESWALQELTRELFGRVAEETALFAVTGDGGTTGCSYRTRVYDRENDDGVPETWAEYGVATWTDLETAETLLAAIAADAAAAGADRTRVLVPEVPRYVSDGAYLRAGISEEPDFVLAAELTADYRSDP